VATMAPGQSYMEYIVLIKTEEARFITIVVSAAIIVCLNKRLGEERCGKNWWIILLLAGFVLFGTVCEVQGAVLYPVGGYSLCKQ